MVELADTLDLKSNATCKRTGSSPVSCIVRISHIWSIGEVGVLACLSRKRSRVQVPYRPFYSRLAQLVERRTVNPNVTGSSPVV